MINRETFKRVKFKIVIFGQIKIDDYQSSPSLHTF